ncbi:LOW QUALITY PROTEIN: hypothetical protein OSB04_019702 [Centaurea solstitialis]|uniref:Reverse transcriptase Ty1/copia-type domain-containing protein n=1 Tax=Centaurea solstitialis TaxID=347529 RepID=A0AA38WEI3_9ASTR|nr:LOW QUALITY PROTEIN: hypothetical protein OSB04_019702 [Centaurea solstitialis]
MEHGIPLPTKKSKVGCYWIFTPKVGPDGKLARLKDCLVAKGYTQIFGLDYGDTFSLVAKMTSIRLLLSVAVMQDWPRYQLDIKNSFLHGDLQEEVYMEQPPGFVAQGESGLVYKLRKSFYGLKQSPRAWFGRFNAVVKEFGMCQSIANHSVFYRLSGIRCTYLIVYVDDIIIIGNDHDGIKHLKAHLFKHFQTKDMGKFRYFLGIEVAKSKDEISISQRKYALDILEETRLTDCKPVESPMDPNVKLLLGQGVIRRSRKILKIVTRPDISFAVSIVSQFLNAPRDTHWEAALRIVKYIKGAPGKALLYENKGGTEVSCYADANYDGCPFSKRSTSGYCIFFGGNQVSLKSKNQNVVARSSVEAEYCAMANATCELIWIKQLLEELRFCKVSQMKLIRDNQAALHIASNPIFHERTKHIEIDYHFVQEKLLDGLIVTEFLADGFTKSLRGPRLKYIYSKLGAYDVYVPFWIMPTLSSLESFECESCHLGKHTRGVFPKCVNNRVSAPFSLVHTHVWSPSRVCSTLGFQYFVTFSDNYSRSTWLFLMKIVLNYFQYSKTAVLK